MAIGSIVHFEIPSKDHDATKKFYSELLGWQFQAQPMPGGNGEYHSTYFNETGIGGGLSDISEHNQPGDVIVYFGTDNLDADLKKVEELGGKVAMPRTEIPGMGSFAVFEDVVGNRLALWQNAEKE